MPVGAAGHPERDVVGVYRVMDVRQSGKAFGYRDHDDVEEEGGNDGPLWRADAAQLPLVQLQMADMDACRSVRQECPDVVVCPLS